MPETLTQIDAPTTGEEAIRALCYPSLHYRNDYYRDSFPVYQRMVHLAFHVGCQNILELGAGLSTALWAKYASRTGAKVTTIDADFDPMRSYIASPELNALIDTQVYLEQGVTITARQLAEFYQNEHDAYAGVSACQIAESLDNFARPAPQMRVDRVRAAASSDGSSPRDIFIPDGATLRFPAPLLDQLSPTGRFAKDIAFLDQHRLAPINPTEKFDLIFFDSGEYSSAVEWLILKDRIPVGGLAAFHDIFFPKSVKNFLPCAALLNNPNWRVVLLDDSTIQGLLIAQRIT